MSLSFCRIAGNRLRINDTGLSIDARLQIDAGECTRPLTRYIMMPPLN